MELFIFLGVVGAYFILLYMFDAFAGVVGKRSREIQKAGLNTKTHAEKTATRLHQILSNPVIRYLWIPDRIKSFDKSAKQIGLEKLKGKDIYNLVGIVDTLVLSKVVFDYWKAGYTVNIKSLGMQLGLAAFFILIPDILLKLMSKDYQEREVEGLADVLELFFANTSAGFNTREILDAIIETLYESPIKKLLRSINQDIKLNTPYDKVFQNFEEKVSDERLIKFGTILREALENDSNIAEYLQNEAEILRDVRRYAMQKQHSKTFMLLLINGGIAVLSFGLIIMVPFILRSLSIFMEIGGR